MYREPFSAVNQGLKRALSLAVGLSIDGSAKSDESDLFVRYVLTRLLPPRDLPAFIQDWAMCGQGQGLTRSETAPLASQKSDATVLLKTIKSEWTNSKLVVAAPLYFVGSPPSDARGKTATLILAVGGASVVAASGFHSPGGVVLHSRTNKSITDFSSTAKYVLDWHKEHFGASSRKVFCAFSGLTQFSPENPHEVEAAIEVRNQYAWSHITTSALDLSFKYVFLFQVNKVKGVPTPPPLRPPIDWSRVEQESLRVEQEEEDIRLGRR